MTENIFGNTFAPREKVASLECVSHLVKEKLAVVVGKVAVGHVGVQEFKCFGFLERKFLIENRKKFRATTFGKFLACLEVGFNLSAVCFVVDEMLVVALFAGNKRYYCCCDYE